MKKIISILLLVIGMMNASAQTKTFHHYSEIAINGDTLNMALYYGKKVMLVNTASYCGYTPQFAQLEQLYKDYKQYNFEIIGFPCNDFGAQDPGNDSTIDHFCHANYGVTFQMMSKIATVSTDTADVYKWLQRKNMNGVSNAHVVWNFNKFLIDEAGHWVKYYDSPTLPNATVITDWIKSASVLTGAVSSASLAKEDVEMMGDPSGSSFDLILKINSPQHFSVSIFSVEGKWLNTIYDGIATDQQRINYNYASLSSGIYFVKVVGANFQKTIKYAVLK